MDNNIQGRMLTVAQAAKRLRRSIEQVRRYLREGKLRGRRIGQQWFIDESALPTRFGVVETQHRTLREAATAAYGSGSQMTETEFLIARINKNREAIRRRLGGDVKADVVEMLREDRESH